MFQTLHLMFEQHYGREPPMKLDGAACHRHHGRGQLLFQADALLRADRGQNGSGARHEMIGDDLGFFNVFPRRIPRKAIYRFLSREKEKTMGVARSGFVVSISLRPVLVLLLMLFGLAPGAAMAQRTLSNGQHLYLPIYAFIQYGDLHKSGDAKQLPVSALVSIHNTDLDKPLKLISARYYSTAGKFLRNFISSSRILKPMETLEFLVERRDVVGGSGANFVIQWESAAPISPPLVQALHVELQTNRAVVFTTEAVLIPR